MRLPFTTEAISNLAPNCTWRLDDEDYDKLTWYESNDLEKPSKEAVEAEAKRLASIAKSLEYKTKRSKEYPPLTDLADAIYWQQQGNSDLMDAYLAKVDEIKQKYPKG